MSATIVPFPGNSGQDDFEDILKGFEDEFDQLEFLQVLVTLNDVETPTWRRIIVPANYALEGLHNIIMVLFAWSGGHYYYFRDGKMFYDDPRMVEGNEISYPEGETHVLADDVTVGEVFTREGMALEYTYDLGDCWDIEIKLEEWVSGAEYPVNIFPVCTGGAGANPPEDVGGSGGYANFCKAVNDPDNPEYEELREWADLEEDEEWNPEFFNAQVVNEVFAATLIDELSDVLVPEDPDELRDAYIDLLAESMARDAGDTLIRNLFIAGLENEV